MAKTKDILNPDAAEIQRLKKLNLVLNKSVKKLLEERGREQAFFDDLKSAITPSTPFGSQPIAVVKETDSEFAMVSLISDWHIGEVISKQETEGFGSFNYAIAARRAFQLAEKIIGSAQMYRKSGHPVNELHVFSLGDMVSGDIHYELQTTNEWPVPIAIVKAAELFAEFIRRLAPHFKKIIVWEVSSDNHGRLTKKNQWKQGAKNNYTRTVHEIANGRLVEHKNVEIVVAEGPSLLCNVQGVKFLVSHGHQIKSQMGIPFYGFLRMKAKEAIRRMAKGAFDYIAIGHFHVPGFVEEILVNGCLSGTSEFDHALGRQSKPSQVTFMVNPKKKILFGWTAWILN